MDRSLLQFREGRGQILAIQLVSFVKCCILCAEFETYMNGSSVFYCKRNVLGSFMQLSRSRQIGGMPLCDGGGSFLRLASFLFTAVTRRPSKLVPIWCETPKTANALLVVPPPPTSHHYRLSNSTWRGSAHISKDHPCVGLPTVSSVLQSRVPQHTAMRDSFYLG